MLRRFSRRKKLHEGDVEAIVDNLNHVLNTKKGYGSWLGPFGIGDYNAYSSRQRIVEQIIAEIEENIKLYEPRVKLEKIQEVESDSPFRLRFEMQCVLLDHPQPLFVIVDSLVNKVVIED